MKIYVLYVCSTDGNHRLASQYNIISGKEARDIYKSRGIY